MKTMHEKILTEKLKVLKRSLICFLSAMLLIASMAVPVSAEEDYGDIVDESGKVYANLYLSDLIDVKEETLTLAWAERDEDWNEVAIVEETFTTPVNYVNLGSTLTITPAEDFDGEYLRVMYECAYKDGKLRWDDVEVWGNTVETMNVPDTYTFELEPFTEWELSEGFKPSGLFYFEFTGYSGMDYSNPYVQSMFFRVVDGSLPETVNPTASKIIVNGQEIAFDAYNINGNNYFKLRDVAKAISGTEKQFDVTWDESKKAINLLSGTPYTETGGELVPGDGTSQSPKACMSHVYQDGELIYPATINRGYEYVQTEAYNIKGNNYFKLRDLGLAFDFDVSWDAENNCVIIDTSKSYTPD